MTIGARVFKTGLAVAIALWIGSLIGLKLPLIAAIASVVMIQPSIYRSWVQVLQQLQSNVLGAAVAIAAVWLVGSSPLSIGIVSVLVILLCIRLRAEETIGLTVVTVVVLMEAHGLGWPLVMDRLAALLTGIVTAFVVNIAIAPPRHRGRFVAQMKKSQTQLSLLLRTAVSNELRENVFNRELSALKGQLRKLEDAYDLYAEERVVRKAPRADRARLLVVYQGMLSALERGVTLIEAVEVHYFAAAADGAWRREIDSHIESLCAYHEHLMWKWDGLLKPGAFASAPPPETSALLERIAGSAEMERADKTRLAVVASAIYAYEERLRRLDKLVEHWQDRRDGAPEDPERLLGL
ncbi:FUSC family protein [Cohnella rhizosphaerae]|uniref:Aromatic acid exporter family protein n=1 Tax=Cohnella rhizosphaerae TaxID=1457232 RepID=A0A9X4QSM9_9BACL|nr:aromatic acid exporter family protein [Cohnella rhizosphaerae]MDG0809755.1 aromatic acid exporter family protein [Cohnella rhizosphaerae]